MAQQDLHNTNINAMLDQPRRITVSQCVRRKILGDAATRGRRGERGRQYRSADRSGALAVGKQPATVVMCLPEVAELIENGLRQWHEPFLVAFADDAQHHVSPANSTNFQRCGFADA